MITHFLNFPFMQSLNIGGLILKPSQIISNKMNLITSDTSRQDNPFVVCIFGERLDLLSVALAASEHEDVKFASLRVFRTGDFVKN